MLKLVDHSYLNSDAALWDSPQGDALQLSVPEGHRGPICLSETGRMVWWTGRVAIGLQYQAPSRLGALQQSEEWLQDVLLQTRQLAA